ncbi:MAG TPA: replication-associated recombination protein A [Thermoleophilaceae bacterium]|nr:replication-associated recombination protein A [Thermoleophilaceae bacterium]
MDRLFAEDEGAATRGRTAVPPGAQPLAARMRPVELGEFVGQEHLLEQGSALRKALEDGHPHSMILYGPPGTGKTTLARLIAVTANAAFEEISAVNAGRKEVREVLDRAAERRRGGNGEGTILFLDEIHRFNKAQQDVLLPAVEEGLVWLVGATTENPYFEVNSALLSRCRVYELRALEESDVLALLRRALNDPERGIAQPPEVDEDALEFLAARAGGDARTALAALELAAETAAAEAGATTPDVGSASPGHANATSDSAGDNDRGHVTLARAEDALQRRAVLYDKDGDRHYDLISAWIKATRGSDPDASLLYMAAMLEGGEDVRFIARRMVILASEDVGNADPQALLIATAAAQAVDRVGLPECHFALAQATVYLALAPKSNAAGAALGHARAWVRENGTPVPPDYLRDAHYPGAKKLGRGEGYDYPHAHPTGTSPQELMPDNAVGRRFLELSAFGHERELAERLDGIRRARRRDPDT